VKINYCKVIDACLKSNCTAPVVNTLIAQVFPISIPIASQLPNKPELANVRKEIANWSVSVGGVKFHTNSKDPYAPSISASVAIGPPGAAKFNVQATGSLRIKTYCRDTGESMVKITPSIALKLGDVPGWMQHITIKNVANNYITDFINQKGGSNGRFSFNWPGILSGKAAPKEADDGPGLAEKLKVFIEAAKNNWEGIKAAVLTAIKGRFQGNKTACSEVAAPAQKKAGGGACHLCMNVKDLPKDLTTVGDEEDQSVGHVTADRVQLHASASRTSQVVQKVDHCTPVKILELEVPGNANFWSKVELGGKAGFMARQFIQRGSGECAPKK
jgi:hypothetical protein